MLVHCVSMHDVTLTAASSRAIPYNCCTATSAEGRVGNQHDSNMRRHSNQPTGWSGVQSPTACGERSAELVTNVNFKN